MKLKKIVEELNELKSNKGNMFYAKALDKNVYVYFKLIACLGDQPERRGINYMLGDGGGGNFGAKFGYSANIKQIQERFPSCTNCLKIMMCDPFYLLKINECDVCVN